MDVEKAMIAPETLGDVHELLEQQLQETFRTVSAIRCVVSVLPAHTAAGVRDARNDPSGIFNSTLRKVPAFTGISGSVRILIAKNEAE